MRLVKKGAILAAAAVAAVFLAGTASYADTFSFNLTVSNANLTGPFATINVNLTSPTTAVITETAISPYGLIDGGILGLNINATTWSFNSLSGTPLPGSNVNLSDGGAGNEDGFGSYNQTFNNQGGTGDALSSVTVTLVNTGATWASATDVLIQNSHHALAAAHISPLDTGLNNGQTFFAAGNGGSGGGGDTIVGPEPASLLLFGLGALGVGARVRRRRVES
jgi:hypothetical protein